MNQKLIKIIVVLFVIIVVIVGVCAFIFNRESAPDETEELNKMSITIKGYTIDIASKEVGHSSSESYFSTSFNIIDDNNYTNTYNVEFVDLKLSSENTSDGSITYDIARPEEVTINGKEFNYYLDDSEEYSTSATLYYIIPDGSLTIKVYGGSVFDSNGDQLKRLAFVNKEVLESKELAEVLNFTIKKKDNGKESETSADIEGEAEIILNQKTDINALKKVKISGTDDYFSITEKLKNTFPQGDGNVTVSSAIVIPYKFIIDGTEF